MIVAYAWVIDGIDRIFVTDSGLDDDWAVDADFASTFVGLGLPTGLSCGINLRTGLPDDETATIKVHDVDGSLAALFRPGTVREADALVSTVEPGPATGAHLYAKHIGLEKIGPAGERRQQSCVPGFNVGMRHLGQNEAFANDVGDTPVSDEARMWPGRRCAIYRLESVDGAWQALSEGTRVWWGTLRGQGSYARRVWSFSCFGPQAWLFGNLGRGIFEDGIAVIPEVVVADNETTLTASLYADKVDVIGVQHSYVNDHTDDTYLASADSYEDVLAAINDFLDDVVSDTSNGTEFNVDGNDIYFSIHKGADGLTVKWKRGDTLAIGDPYTEKANSVRISAVLYLTAHEKIWRTLGYDVREQGGNRDPVEHADTYVSFSRRNNGYWQGRFTSGSPSVIKAEGEFDYTIVEQNDEYSNGGHPRLWPTLYPGGCVSFTGEIDQASVGTTWTWLSVTGWLETAVASDDAYVVLQDFARTSGGTLEIRYWDVSYGDYAVGA